MLKLKHPLQAGQRIKFEYHCDESKDSTDYELFLHTKQEATIVEPIEMPDADRHEVGGQMYKVRFDDGFTWGIFNDEIVGLIVDSKLLTRIWEDVPDDQPLPEDFLDYLEFAELKP